MIIVQLKGGFAASQIGIVSCLETILEMLKTNI